MTLEAWSEFNVAVAGATAALAGLLIVALSVNVSKIATAPALSARAASAIATLVLAVVAASVALIPEQPVWAIGVELGIGLVVAWVMQVHSMVMISRAGATDGDTNYNTMRIRAAKTVPGLVPLVAFTIGCLLLLLGMPEGYFAVATGCILAIIAAVLFSWIALVEVLR